MDTSACNYNPIANQNAECIFNSAGFDCDGNLSIELGDTAYGGVVFYVDYENDLAIVVSPQNIGTHIFGCQGVDIPGALNDGLGYGKSNTLTIDSWCGNYAARACLDYENGGYDDWYLPTIAELTELHNNIGVGSSSIEVCKFRYFIYFWFVYCN